MDVTKQGEESGFNMPCLLAAAKHDLGSYPLASGYERVSKGIQLLLNPTSLLLELMQ